MSSHQYSLQLRSEYFPTLRPLWLGYSDSLENSFLAAVWNDIKTIKDGKTFFQILIFLLTSLAWPFILVVLVRNKKKDLEMTWKIGNNKLYQNQWAEYYFFIFSNFTLYKAVIYQRCIGKLESSIPSLVNRTKTLRWRVRYILQGNNQTQQREIDDNNLQEQVD